MNFFLLHVMSTGRAGLFWRVQDGFTHVPKTLVGCLEGRSQLAAFPLHAISGSLHMVFLVGWLDFLYSNSQLQETKVEMPVLLNPSLESFIA